MKTTRLDVPLDGQVLRIKTLIGGKGLFSAWKISLRRYKWLYLLILPSLAYYAVFHYYPLYGVTLAFKDFKIFQGILASPFADPPIRHFVRLFDSPDFWRAVGNTFLISLYKIVFAFPAPIILALLLNEVTQRWFRRIVETLMYLPHFISWVVIGGIMFNIFSINGGLVNELLSAFGVPSKQFMAESSGFRAILVGSNIWREMGWGSIVYLAALAGVDQNLYEAARIDGANRFHLLVHITLPQIFSTIAVMLILNLGQVMNAGFEQVFILYSMPVYDVADIIDTYVYRLGILSMEYSMATAAGLFKSLIGLVFIVSANSITKKMGQSGIF